MRRISAIASTIALTATAFIGISSIAQASEDPAAPKAKILNQGDLAAFGGVKSPAKWTWSISSTDTDRVNALCLDTKGQPILFPDSNGWAAGGQLKGKGYKSLDELVIDYQNADAATSAWSALLAGSANCATKTREELEAGHPREYNAVTQTKVPVDSGFGLLTTSVVNSTERAINGSRSSKYTVYMPSGTAIIEVVYYSNPGKTVNKAIIARTNALAKDLAERWS